MAKLSKLEQDIKKELDKTMEFNNYQFCDQCFIIENFTAVAKDFLKDINVMLKERNSNLNLEQRIVLAEVKTRFLEIFGKFI